MVKHQSLMETIIIGALALSSLALSANKPSQSQSTLDFTYSQCTLLAQENYSSLGRKVDSLAQESLLGSAGYFLLGRESLPLWIHLSNEQKGNSGEPAPTGL